MPEKNIFITSTGEHGLRISSKPLLLLAAKIRSQLLAHKLMGINHYPLLEGMVSQHEEVEQKAVQCRKFSGEATASVSRNRRPGNSRVPIVPGDDSIEKLYQEVAQCQYCMRTGQGKLAGPALDKSDLRLMIVGDYRTQDEGKETLFGTEEDTMLARMLAALNLTHDQVYITNVLKCGCRTDIFQKPELSDQCTGYLFREIMLVKPSVICAMGELAGQVLLGKKISISRVRGRFYPYRFSEVWPAQVMTTYHPRFLLNNVEMKPATWADLQLIQKHFLR